MAVEYPSSLRYAIQSGKSRTISNQFIGSQPLSGTPYFQKLTDETTVVWDFRLVFNQSDAEYFDAWFVASTESGNLWFEMPIRTEQGLITHECHFTEDGIPNSVSESGNTFTYSCSVIARSIVRPVDPQFILDAREDYGPSDYSLLDIALNRDWQEFKSATYLFDINVTGAGQNETPAIENSFAYTSEASQLLCGGAWNVNIPKGSFYTVTNSYLPSSTSQVYISESSDPTDFSSVIFLMTFINGDLNINLPGGGVTSIASGLTSDVTYGVEVESGGSIYIHYNGVRTLAVSSSPETSILSFTCQFSNAGDSISLVTNNNAAVPANADSGTSKLIDLNPSRVE